MKPRRTLPQARPPRVALISLGCPKNLVDSEKMLGQLAEAGCTIIADAAAADVVVVNTCGFLAAAREESLGVIREALALKAGGSAQRVVVAGCLAQRDGENLARQVKGVDAIVGINNRNDLARAVLGSEAEGGGTFTAVQSYAQRLGGGAAAVGEDTGRLRLTPRHTAYLRVGEGCSQGCTFCTIPAITGPFRSKGPHQVLAEAAELVADGAIELNIIGQDTTSYGRDIGFRPGLGGLLRLLDKLEGVQWIRLMYAYPTGVDDRLIEALAESPRVVKYLDIPLQHIADPILSAMRRKITQRKTEALLEKLRRRVSGLHLRTTFIVGFPGETREHFRQLLDFVQAFKFDAVGVFEYSSERGTPAARLSGRVGSAAARRRREQLMLAQQEVAFAANAAAVGKPLRVLVDGQDARGRCVGRHAGQAPDVDSICYLTAQRAAGKILDAQVVGWQDYDLVVRPSRKPGPKRTQ
jgi:ribosomal protein S12 methylthiotransferase